MSERPCQSHSCQRGCSLVSGWVYGLRACFAPRGKTRPHLFTGKKAEGVFYPKGQNTPSGSYGTDMVSLTLSVWHGLSDMVSLTWSPLHGWTQASRHTHFEIEHAPSDLLLPSALWAEGGWKLKLTRVHATEYGIYVTKYLLVWKKTQAALGNIRNNVF